MKPTLALIALDHLLAVKGLVGPLTDTMYFILRLELVLKGVLNFWSSAARYDFI